MRKQSDKQNSQKTNHEVNYCLEILNKTVVVWMRMALVVTYVEYLPTDLRNCVRRIGRCVPVGEGVSLGVAFEVSEVSGYS